MRFPVSLDTQHLFSTLAAFIAITGWGPWERRREELTFQLRENFLLADLFRERHQLELGLFRLADERRRRTKPRRQIQDALEYQIAAFMATTVGFYQRLDAAGKDRLAGRLRDGLQSDTALNALCHEMTTAAHFLQQGFDVDPSDLRAGGGFDFLIADGRIEAEVECKLATSDIGRRIHRRHMLTLGRAIQPELVKLGPNMAGGHFVNVLLPERLSANLALHRRIADAVATVLRDKQSVNNKDFQVSAQFFDLASTPFGEKDRISVHTRELSAFVRTTFGKPNANVMAHGIPGRLGIVVCVESTKKDRVAHGIYHQLRDAATRQFSKKRPGVLVIRLADLSDGQLMSLANSENQKPNALQAIAGRLLDGEDREFLDTVAFLGSGTVSSRTIRNASLKTIVIGGTAPCYFFRGGKADRAYNFFRVE